MACRLRRRPVSRAIVSKKGGLRLLSSCDELCGSHRTSAGRYTEVYQNIGPKDML
jgi:hypothetical protein